MLMPTFDDLQQVEAESINGAFLIRYCRLTSFEHVACRPPLAVYMLQLLELPVEREAVLDLTIVLNIQN